MLTELFEQFLREGVAPYPTAGEGDEVRVEAAPSGKAPFSATR